MSEENKDNSGEKNENKDKEKLNGSENTDQNPPKQTPEETEEDNNPKHSPVLTNKNEINKEKQKLEGSKEELKEFEQHLNQRFRASVAEIWDIIKQISFIRFLRYFGKYFTPNFLKQPITETREWLQKVGHIIDIRDGTDEYNTIKGIEEGIEIKGYNIWILMASAMLASIGLDVNSGAVIIGAMLISPLMNPILGVGLGLGINDWNMSRHALQNLAIAVAVSILTSVIYFWVTPFGDATTEIMARTEPTLLDVFVAIFGGVAGIVSNSRYEKTNAIPGVAIATALMPPICVAGFGLATFDLVIFGGAFYLFFINAVFISISTFTMVRYFGFEPRIVTDRKTRRKITFWMFVISLILVIPSVWFLISLYNKSQEAEKIETFVIQPINQNPRYEVIEQKRENGHIKIYLSAENEIPENLQEEYTKILLENGVTDTLEISRVNISKEEIENLSADLTTGVVNLEKRFSLIENRFDSLKVIQDIIEEQTRVAEWQDTLKNELKIFFEDLDTLIIMGWNPPSAQLENNITKEEEKKQLKETNTEEYYKTYLEEKKFVWRRAYAALEILAKYKKETPSVWDWKDLKSRIIKEAEENKTQGETSENNIKEEEQNTDSLTKIGEKNIIIIKLEWKNKVPYEEEMQRIRQFLALKMDLDIIRDSVFATIDTIYKDSIEISGDTIQIPEIEYKFRPLRDSLILKNSIEVIPAKKEEEDE